LCTKKLVLFDKAPGDFGDVVEGVFKLGCAVFFFAFVLKPEYGHRKKNKYDKKIEEYFAAE
jgi:hypothetical protein